MMTEALALVNGRLFDGQQVYSDRCVMLRGAAVDSIVETSAVSSATVRTFDVGGRTLTPGLIDLQVNGGGGVLFNDDPSPRALRTMTEAHRRFGTTSMTATLISDDLDKIESAINATRQAIDEGVPGLIGLHLEGPVLSSDKAGIHDSRKFVGLGEDLLRLLESSGLKHLLVTLAPERVSPSDIRRLADAGVIVCAGHSAADYETVKVAIDHGLSGVTHLYNAMSPLESRAPGMVGAALEDERVWCGIIADGYHVHPAALKIAIKAKPHGKAVLVTDAMSSVGTSLDAFVVAGQQVLVEDGRCTSPDGVLAGSSLTMIDAVRNTVKFTGLEWFEAIRMASLYPASAIGAAQSLGRLAPGWRANILEIDEQGEPIASWIDGIRYAADG